MEIKKNEILTGGKMNTPIKIGNTVRRCKTESTNIIHRLLKHLRNKGINWVPEPMGFDEDGKEILSYIPGEVPHEMPDWIWEENVLNRIAKSMRLFHDATMDFKLENDIWQLEESKPREVICHNDFAPYNCVFLNKQFSGLIDFDMCSPGSRLWDLSYTAYRFVPIMPDIPVDDTSECSPFNEEKMIKRIKVFIDAYASNEKKYSYNLFDLLKMVSKRLVKLSIWTEKYGNEHNDKSLIKNSKMYKFHSDWILKLLKKYY